MDGLFPQEITLQEIPAFKVRWTLHGFEIVEGADVLYIIREDLSCVVYGAVQNGYARRGAPLDGVKLVGEAMRESVERWFAERWPR